MLNRLSLLAMAGLFLVLGCTKKAETPPPGAGASAVPAAQATGKTIQLGIWSNYLAATALPEFEKRTGIKVQVSHYSSNEELLAKLQAGASGYDLVVPSDYMVQVMAKLGLAKKLDRSKIPNFASLDPRYLKKGYDPANEYSVPYNAGTTGIAVNRSLYAGPIKGWKDLFEKPDLAGKIALLDDSRETIGAALKALGFSLNSKDPAQLGKAKELLRKARSRVKAFNSETLAALTSGEFPVSHAYVTDALQARRNTGGKIEYILPEEGGTFWIDTLVIPSTAKNVEEAHQLINFLLEPQIAATTVQNVLVSPASAKVLSLLPPGFDKENSALFPSDAVLSKFEMIEDLGDAVMVWDRIWTEVKAER